MIPLARHKLRHSGYDKAIRHKFAVTHSSFRRPPQRWPKNDRRDGGPEPRGVRRLGTARGRLRIPRRRRHAPVHPGPRLEAYKNGGISADSAYSGQSTASHPPPSEPDAPPDLDPSFEQPTEAPQPANHMTLVNVTTVPGPEPQSSTSASAKGSVGSTANVIDSQQDSQRPGSQVSTPRTSPSKVEAALKNLRTDFQAAEVQRQAEEVQRREDSKLLISALALLTEQVANLAKAFPVSPTP